jgi:hypothetical protein
VLAPFCGRAVPPAAGWAPGEPVVAPSTFSSRVQGTVPDQPSASPEPPARKRFRRRGAVPVAAPALPPPGAVTGLDLSERPRYSWRTLLTLVAALLVTGLLAASVGALLVKYGHAPTTSADKKGGKK